MRETKTRFLLLIQCTLCLGKARGLSMVRVGKFSQSWRPSTVGSGCHRLGHVVSLQSCGVCQQKRGPFHAILWFKPSMSKFKMVIPHIETHPARGPLSEEKTCEPLQLVGNCFLPSTGPLEFWTPKKLVVSGIWVIMAESVALFPWKTRPEILTF